MQKSEINYYYAMAKSFVSNHRETENLEILKNAKYFCRISPIFQTNEERKTFYFAVRQHLLLSQYMYFIYFFFQVALLLIVGSIFIEDYDYMRSSERHFMIYVMIFLLVGAALIYPLIQLYVCVHCYLHSFCITFCAYLLT